MDTTSASCCVPLGPKAPRRLPSWATRNRLLGAGGVLLVAGMAFNWGWLTAVGAAPILLAMAPCAAMCALGLCMVGMKRTAPAPLALPPPRVE